MFGIGEGELLIIALFGFMLFGPDKLPGMGRTIGRALRQFRTAQDDFTNAMQTEIVNPLDSLIKDEKTPSIEDELDAADSDDDLDAGAQTTSAKKESFAARKARLAAEKAASEQGDSSQNSVSDADSDEDIEETQPTSQPEPAPQKAKRSAADLYGLSETSREEGESSNN